MKWHNLMILLASLMLVAVAFADEIEIPDDIDDEDLDEDEEILRLLEEKKIVSLCKGKKLRKVVNCRNYFCKY